MNLKANKGGKVRAEEKKRSEGFDRHFTTWSRMVVDAYSNVCLKCLQFRNNFSVVIVGYLNGTRKYKQNFRYDPDGLHAGVLHMLHGV